MPKLKYPSFEPGLKVNRLTVIKKLERVKNRRRWLWKCDCGLEKSIEPCSVFNGTIKSCGCLRKERILNYNKRPREKQQEKITHQGYRLIYKPSHPNSHWNGYVYEHRYNMSNHLQRPLTEEENVHHVNGNKLDNRLENLELWSTSQPCGQRVIDKVNWAKKILEQYPNYV